MGRLRIGTGVVGSGFGSVAVGDALELCWRCWVCYQLLLLVLVGSAPNVHHWEWCHQHREAACTAAVAAAAVVVGGREGDCYCYCS